MTCINKIKGWAGTFSGHCVSSLKNDVTFSPGIKIFVNSLVSGKSSLFKQMPTNVSGLN